MTGLRPSAPDPAKTHPLLTDLVYNSLDPGYAEAATRRGTARPRRWYDTAALAVGVAALIGALQPALRREAGCPPCFAGN